ncbi:MAG TPA: hypothetical protein VHM21_04500 [Sphingomicrobium sp.]|jgi:hypothetical protein|nr:hypothetical protein [Sphingomicrobium sp.]
MTDKPPTEEQKVRRRWINLGEFVAVAGLIISGLALWNSWQREDDQPAAPVVVEKERRIPLALRGTVDDDGKQVTLAAIEPGHSIDSLTITATGSATGTASVGSGGALTAREVESWFPKDAKRDAGGTLRLTVATDYIEAGEDRTAKQLYLLSYRWSDGGLFGGKSLRLTGWRRA